MVSSSFAIGVLGRSLFGLGTVDAFLVCLFFNLLGILTVCFFSCFGPPFGLRQMVLSRFWFGWYPVKISKCLVDPNNITKKNASVYMISRTVNKRF